MAQRKSPGNPTPLEVSPGVGVRIFSLLAAESPLGVFAAESGRHGGKVGQHQHPKIAAGNGDDEHDQSTGTAINK